MAVGHNTVASEHLRAFVERIEKLLEDKKALAEDLKAVKAESKGMGFDTGTLMAVVKIREMGLDDYAEGEALKDTYLHALGMMVEPPLFRAAGLSKVDPMIREHVAEHLHAVVPPFGQGTFEFKWHGKSYRLERAKDGKVHEHEFEPPSSGEAEEAPAKRKKTARDVEVPDVDAPGAEALGREYAQANRPVTHNPFPYGDARRARFDEGWRSESGKDGFGPNERDE